MFVIGQNNPFKGYCPGPSCCFALSISYWDKLSSELHQIDEPEKTQIWSEDIGHQGQNVFSFRARILAPHWCLKAVKKKNFVRYNTDWAEYLWSGDLLLVNIRPLPGIRSGCVVDKGILQQSQEYKWNADVVPHVNGLKWTHLVDGSQLGSYCFGSVKIHYNNHQFSP